MAAAALDVRDKEELAALRASRRRDVILWRVAMGCAAALALLAGGEIARFGGLQWQKVRQMKLGAQRPRVEAIMASNALATRIEDLATKRLLPLEMLTIVLGGADSSLLPPGMMFTSVKAGAASGLYTLIIDAQTNNAGQVSVYQSALESFPLARRSTCNCGTRGAISRPSPSRSRSSPTPSVRLPPHDPHPPGFFPWLPAAREAARGGVLRAGGADVAVELQPPHGPVLARPAPHDD
jgi:hypothetical protein